MAAVRSLKMDNLYNVYVKNQQKPSVYSELSHPLRLSWAELRCVALSVVKCKAIGIKWHPQLF